MVQLCQLTRQVQSNAYAVIRERTLHESVEQLFSLLLLDTNAIVYHLEKQFVGLPVLFYPQGNHPLGRSIFDGVRQQVAQNGIHLLLVDRKRHFLGKGTELIFDLLVLRDLLEVTPKVARKAYDFRFLHMECNLPLLHLGEIQQSVDQAFHPLGALLHIADRLLDAAWKFPLVTDIVHGSQDDC